MRGIAAGLMALALASGSAGAEGAPPAAETVRDRALLALRGIGSEPATFEDMRERLERRFAGDDLNGGGIDASDHRLSDEKHAASLRASALSGWAKQDLDGDGRVTAQEMRRTLEPLARQSLARRRDGAEASAADLAAVLDARIKPLLEPDLDGDGAVSFDEALAEANRGAQERMAQRQDYGPRIGPAFDRDGDGTVVLTEFLAATEAVLAEFDRNGDRRLDAAEVDALQAEVTAARNRADQLVRQRAAERQVDGLRRDCAIGDAGEARLVVVEAERGAAVPTSSIGDQGLATSLAEITVVPGEGEILAVVAAKTPMLFRFGGATGRIRRVVAIGATAGFEGIPVDRVRWLPDDCGRAQLWRPVLGKADLAQIVGVLAGRAPSAAVSTEQVGLVRLPHGAWDAAHRFAGQTVPELTTQAAADVWTRFIREFPGGLVEVEPSAIVSQGAATRYDLPPFEAGIAVLVEAGLLEPVVMLDDALTAVNPEIRPDGSLVVKGMRIQAGSKDRVILGNRIWRRDPAEGWVSEVIPSYLVRGKIAIPAGAGVGNRAIFRLPAGMPEPDGAWSPSAVQRLD